MGAWCKGSHGGAGAGLHRQEARHYAGREWHAHEQGDGPVVCCRDGGGGYKAARSLARARMGNGVVAESAHGSSRCSHPSPLLTNAVPHEPPPSTPTRVRSSLRDMFASSWA